MVRARARRLGAGCLRDVAPFLVLACLGMSAVLPGTWHRDAGNLTLSVPTAAERADEAFRPRPFHPYPLSSHESSVHRITAVLRELGLPMPPRITLHLYETPASLERGLIDVGRLSPAAARAMGDFAAGVSFDDTLLLLETESRRGPRAWLRLLAHEMTHLSQIELAGAEERGERWLSEGMAEWIAFTVLDRLGVSPIAVERARLLARAREVVGREGPDLRLSELGTARTFLDRAGRVGPLALYNVSFLLADRLIQRHGLSALVEYFRLFAAADDRPANFAAAFGRDIDDFEREVVASFPVATEPP